MIVPAVGDPPPPTAVLQAVRALTQGQPVAIPTDTVYGLAVDPFRPGSTDRIFEAKRRPRDVSLPLLVTGVEMALSVATAVPDLALELMAAYWPGPLTLVLPAKPGLHADLGDDEATVGVRSPDHPVPQALCAAAGPLGTTSANRHGEPPLTTAEEVASAFGAAISIVLDGGTCAGSPSTVVDCTGQDLKLLREGRIPWAELLAFAPDRP
ncbi:MAG TPA: L-threonylcarbamoyladenylate synthase [Acidimicrobiales bacterium]|jgi:L-threonylcarbamoyladenylate synthase|nr:L-threonylcarbamoyladenylate synthase [Acidimicrobiales bacterium]